MYLEVYCLIPMMRFQGFKRWLSCLKWKWYSLSHVQLFATQGLKPTRPLCLWNSSGKNTGGGCHSFIQGIFLTQGLKPGLLHCRQILSGLSHQQAFLLNLSEIEIQVHPGPLLRWDERCRQWPQEGSKQIILQIQTGPWTNMFTFNSFLL